MRHQDQIIAPVEERKGHYDYYQLRDLFFHNVYVSAGDLTIQASATKEELPPLVDGVFLNARHHLEYGKERMRIVKKVQSIVVMLEHHGLEPVIDECVVDDYEICSEFKTPNGLKPTVLEKYLAKLSQDIELYKKEVEKS